MNKFIIFLFSILTFKNTFSQKKGTYIGLYTPESQVYPITGQIDTIIEGKKHTIFTFEKVEWNGKKKLVLLKKGKFYFEYLGGCYAFSSREQKRKCYGQYKLNKDTLLLTSTYKQSDFYSIVEKKVDTIPLGKIMIVTNYPNIQVRPTSFINGFDLKLNDTLIGSFKIKDTIYCKSNEVNKLFFICCSPYPMEWSYIPKNAESNFFNVTLTREIEGENLFINSSKLLVREKKLIVMTGEYIGGVKDGVYIKK
jgi:hypothetical protein